MARVMLTIGDQEYPVACRDGEEARLEMLGAMLAERWPEAEKAAGNAGAIRVFLLSALMLADELADAKAAAAGKAAGARSVDDATLDRLAARLETLAEALEEIVPNP